MGKTRNDYNSIRLDNLFCGVVLARIEQKRINKKMWFFIFVGPCIIAITEE